MAEVVDSMSFPTYAENNLKIVTMQGKLEYLHLNEPQQLVHTLIERQRAAGLPMRVLILKARRTGISTYVGARFFREINKRENRFATVCSADAETTDKVYGMVRLFQEEIPHDTLRKTKWSWLATAVRRGRLGSRSVCNKIFCHFSSLRASVIASCKSWFRSSDSLTSACGR